MAKSISASVGRLGGINRPDDVKVVQDLLNKVPVYSGGPSPLLVPDSKCGPKTIAAIQNFQLKHFGWKGADGRVDPGRQTLALLNTFDTPGVVPPLPVPPKPQALPTSSRFIIIRMGSAPSFTPIDQELFFRITDMVNGLLGIYWLQQTGRPMTMLKPPAQFTGASRFFLTKAPHAVDKLGCPSMYSSREKSGNISSRMVLFLPTGAVGFDMPHHMIGPGGSILPGGDIGLAIGGDLKFVQMG